MKTKSLGLALFLAACSSSSNGTTTTTGGGTTGGTTGATTTGGTTGSCPTALCDGVCCAADQDCLPSGSGHVCGTRCNLASSCPSGGCCYLVNGGSSQNYCTGMCGGMCCNPGAYCLTDTAGNSYCGTACTASTGCPSATPCCQPLADGTGACIPNANATACRCLTGSECSSGACAPATDSSGNPVGPYVCKANDGALYDGCNGVQTCAGNGCCVQDTESNYFCSTTCTNSSTCGAAMCNTYSFNKTTCSGPTACGP